MCMAPRGWSAAIQAVSGGQLLLYDPQGGYLRDGAGDGGGPGATQAIARLYTLTGTDLCQRFPDQFAQGGPLLS